ncbi:unnamed protein product [Fraxinus pennsylvanica]|uniref:DUF4283 domain-containing protein n=1 Tax=Fraxinus pennsylvanica TaxID=56036 RepID=A0AAD1Z9C6_9LAMI|nr:unnamed protein product [Fraxinus pennsylvanica]
MSATPMRGPVNWSTSSGNIARWTKEFNLEKEPSLAAQWIFLPGLPLHLYRVDCLQILATSFGRYLGMNNATLNRTRATGARIYVEVDLKEEPIQGFPIVMALKKLWQEARYERHGFYCSKCSRQGYTAIVCRAGKIHKREIVHVGKQGIRREIWRIKQSNEHDAGANTKQTNDLMENSGINVETLAIVKETEPQQLEAVHSKGDTNLDRVDRDMRKEWEIRHKADYLTEQHKEGNMHEEGSFEQIQDRMGI